MTAKEHPEDIRLIWISMFLQSRIFYNPENYKHYKFVSEPHCKSDGDVYIGGFGDKYPQKQEYRILFDEDNPTSILLKIGNLLMGSVSVCRY